MRGESAPPPSSLTHKECRSIFARLEKHSCCRYWPSHCPGCMTHTDGITVCSSAMSCPLLTVLQIILNPEAKPGLVWTSDMYNRCWRGLRVRVGVHYGQAQIIFDDTTKGYDYYGRGPPPVFLLSIHFPLGLGPLAQRARPMRFTAVLQITPTAHRQLDFHLAPVSSTKLWCDHGRSPQT